MNQSPNTHPTLYNTDADGAPHGWHRIASLLIGGTGLLGGIACTTSMTIAALGFVGAAVVQASHLKLTMADMNATSGPAVHHSNPVLAFLIAAGPTILIVSAVLFTLSLGLRRRWTVVPALAVGALMYWGMYVQSSVTIMYVASGIGIVIWLLLFVAVSLLPQAAGSPTRFAHEPTITGKIE